MKMQMIQSVSIVNVIQVKLRNVMIRSTFLPDRRNETFFASDDQRKGLSIFSFVPNDLCLVQVIHLSVPALITSNFMLQIWLITHNLADVSDGFAFFTGHRSLTSLFHRAPIVLQIWPPQRPLHCVSDRRFLPSSVLVWGWTVVSAWSEPNVLFFIESDHLMRFYGESSGLVSFLTLLRCRRDHLLLRLHRPFAHSGLTPLTFDSRVRRSAASGAHTSLPRSGPLRARAIAALSFCLFGALSDESIEIFQRSGGLIAKRSPPVPRFWFRDRRAHSWV
jgi:hypothetical protein